MTDASAYLQTLARQLVAAHRALPELKAALLTGSSAQGISDNYSDIDLILYYGTLPDTFPLALALPPIWQVGAAESGAVMMAHKINGIECQLVHITLDALDMQLQKVQVELDVESPTQKALSGILEGLPLFGDELIATLKARAAAYPAALQRKMIEAHLSFFPLWNTDGWRGVRDCALWQAELRFTTGKNILAILCGLNRVYFTSFQLKHTQYLCSKLVLTPPHLATRLERALLGDLDELRTLVEETLSLVETHTPEISTETARRQIARTWTPWEPKPIPDL
jgi:hypothetical protein